MSSNNEMDSFVPAEGPPDGLPSSEDVDSGLTRACEELLSSNLRTQINPQHSLKGSNYGPMMQEFPDEGFHSKRAGTQHQHQLLHQWIKDNFL